MSVETFSLICRLLQCLDRMHQDACSIGGIWHVYHTERHIACSIGGIWHVYHIERHIACSIGGIWHVYHK
jgi:cbb3-type cytochrome oxidase subunit 3